MTTTLITGSTRGIGRATAQALAARGHRVVVTGRDGRDAESVAQALRDQGHQASGVAMDVTDPASVRAAATHVRERWGGLDVLVNNVGIVAEDPSAGSLSPADAFRTTMATNVTGTATVTETFLPLLRQSAQPRIVNVSTRMGSIADQQDPGSPFHGMFVPAYQASKAALNSLTAGLAEHLRETPAKVTSVCPGFVQTDLTPMNRAHATRSAEEGAQVVVRAATLGPEAETGTFVDADGPVPW